MDIATNVASSPNKKGGHGAGYEHNIDNQSFLDVSSSNKVLNQSPQFVFGKSSPYKHQLNFKEVPSGFPMYTPTFKGGLLDFKEKTSGATIGEEESTKNHRNSKLPPISI